MSSEDYSAGPFIPAADAFGRMSAEQAREAEAYSLGVQTVLWGMQWVKAGAGLRHFGQRCSGDICRNDPPPRIE